MKTREEDLLIAHSACAPFAPGAARQWVLGSDVSTRVLEQHGGDFSELRVLQSEPIDRTAFERDVACERQRYERYVPLLAQRLRRIHGLDYPDLFWERVMGMSLLMHVSNVLRIHRACEFIVANGGMACVRSADLRRADWVPPNEGAYRQCFQFEEGGDERLVIAYARLFPDRLRLTEVDIPDTEPGPEPQRARAVMPAPGLFIRLWRRRHELLPELLIRILRKLVSPRLLATQLYWRTEARQRIELQSLGRIRFDTIQLPQYGGGGGRLEWRAILADAPEGADDFDLLFFESLRMSAPASWLEALPRRIAAARETLSAFPDVCCIINESLDEDSLLLFAVAAQCNVSTVLVEHNYLQQQYLGNMVWYMARKVDLYLSLGWADVRYPTVVPAGSCFGWVEGPRDKSQIIDVLYISGVCVTRPTVTSAGYSTSGTINSARYLAMKKAFFDRLSPSVCKRVHYRDYPEWKRSTFGVHSLDRQFSASLKGRVGVVDDQGEGSCTQLLRRCRIVVTDYCSTTYIQALMADVPTIVLFNRASYYLEQRYRGFFDELISAKIFHPDPVEAAAFLETIIDSPEVWWNSRTVKDARSGFLQRNLRSEDVLQSYVLALMHGRSPSSLISAAGGGE